jgi:hypothetical protein
MAHIGTRLECLLRRRYLLAELEAHGEAWHEQHVLHGDVEPTNDPLATAW